MHSVLPTLSSYIVLLANVDIAYNILAPNSEAFASANPLKQNSVGMT